MSIVFCGVRNFCAEYRCVDRISTEKTHIVVLDGTGNEGDTGCGIWPGRSENTDNITSDTDSDGRAASAAVMMRDRTRSGRVKAKPATVQDEGESDYQI